MDAMRRVGVLSLNILLLGLISTQQTFAQVKTQPDDVVRVKTELVQTDVTVVDKRGRFVDGLNANDFELYVDSKLQPLSLTCQCRLTENIWVLTNQTAKQLSTFWESR